MSSENSEPGNTGTETELIVRDLVEGIDEQEVLIQHKHPSDGSQQGKGSTADEDPTFNNEAGTEEAMEAEESSAEIFDVTQEAQEEEDEEETPQKDGTRTKRKYRRGATFDPSILAHLQLQHKTSKSRRYAQKYRTQWEEMFSWCRRSPKSELLFHCTLCRQDYFGGISELTRHAVTKKHERNANLAEAGLLTEEEPAPIVAPANIKVERNSTQATTPQTPVNRVAEPASDAFDVFGKHVANKLRTLTSQQNKFAQKLIMDVLFEGEMEALDRNTKVVKCGVSCVCQQ